MSKVEKKKGVSSLIGLAVSAIVIIVMVIMVPWAEVAREVMLVEAWYFIPVLIVTMVNLYLRAFRWRFLLPAEHPVSTQQLYEFFMIGNLATFILPMRAGEFIRPLLLSRKTPHRFSVGFASVIIERFFDLAAVLFSFFVVIFFIPQVPAVVFKGAVVLGSIAIAILAVMIVSSFAARWTERVILGLLALMPNAVGKMLEPLALEFVRGAAVLTNHRRLFVVIALTIAVWSTSFLQFYYFLPMFHLEPSVAIAVTIGVIVALAVAAPSAPGFVGVYQGGCVAAFALFALPTDKAVAYSIVSHVFQYLLIVGVGGYYLLRNNLSLSELRSNFKREAQV